MRKLIAHLFSVLYLATLTPSPHAAEPSRCLAKFKGTYVSGHDKFDFYKNIIDLSKGGMGVTCDGNVAKTVYIFPDRRAPHGIYTLDTQHDTLVATYYKYGLRPMAAGGGIRTEVETKTWKLLNSAVAPTACAQHSLVPSHCTDETGGKNCKCLDVKNVCPVTITVRYYVIGTDTWHRSLALASGERSAHEACTGKRDQKLFFDEWTKR